MGGEDNHRATSCKECIEQDRECDRKRPLCTQCAHSVGDRCDPGDGFLVNWDRTQQPRYLGSKEVRLQLDLSEAQSRLPDLGVAARHRDLVEGMAKIYNTLLKLRYFKSTHLWGPPHRNPPLAFQGLRMAGYDLEVIEVMQHLPFMDPTSESYSLGDLQVAPDSTSMSYTNPGNEVDSSRDPFRSGYNDIAPWSFRLTNGGGRGIHYIYNTRDQTIISWCPKNIRNFSYLDLPARPAASVLEEWHDKLISLTWLPYLYEYGPPEILDTPEYYLAIQQNPEMFAHGAQGMKGWNARALCDEANRYHALQNIYLQHGWPAAFDGDMFEAAREIWSEKCNGLGSMVGPEFGNTVFEGMLDVSDRLSEFLKKGAGERAV